MLRRKITIVGSVAAMLASSVVGATALRSPHATAVDLSQTLANNAEGAQQALDQLGGATNELVTPPVDTTGGLNESLILVIAAQVQPSEALPALEEINTPFGELQGFSLDASENYDVTGAFVQTSPEALSVACGAGLDCPDGVTTVNELQPVELQYADTEELSSIEPLANVLGNDLQFVPGRSLVLSGFRTKRGAEEFMGMARTFDVRVLAAVQARKIGGGDIGLGQEPHPDGSGPLLSPLPDQERYQR